VRKPALICGPSGVGKTSLCTALLYGYQIWDDSMLPEGDTISQAMDMLVNRKSLQTSKRAIIIDLEGLSERGVLGKYLKPNSIPILLTCDDIYEFKVYQSACEVFVLHRPSLETAKTTLLQCMKRLDVPLSSESASMVLDISQGNVRNALNTLQFMVSTKKRKRHEQADLSATSFTDKGSNLFEDAQRLCCGFLRDDSYDLAASDADMSMLMLQNNLPLCVPNIRKLGESLDALSSSEVLSSRYLTDHATVLSVTATALACKGARSTRLQFPTSIAIESRRSAMEKKIREAGSVAGEKPSVVLALDNLHVLKHIKHKNKDIQAIRKKLFD
jgi:hypothetical protein